MQSAPVLKLHTRAPWYAHRWPWFLMLGPALVVVAGVITGWIAYTRQDAMVVEDYYKRGKTINLDLRRDRVASARALAFEARYDAARGQLQGTLAGAAGPERMPFRILLAHPTQPAKDLQLAATPDAEGRFVVALPLLERARWQVVVEDGKHEWRLGAQWHWPEQRNMAIRADAANAP